MHILLEVIDEMLSEKLLFIEGEDYVNKLNAITSYISMIHQTDMVQTIFFRRNYCLL